MLSTNATSSSRRARWAKIREFAREARADRALFIASAIYAVVYNLLGGLDILSTVAGLQTQLAVESNPVVRMFMDNFANGWILAKLALQLLVTAMILWFPHRLVLAMFTLPLVMMVVVVHNNLQIAGLM